MAYGGVALLLLAAAATGVDIATRRTLGLGLVGLIDLTQLLVMACAFACIPLTFLRGAQVEVDLLTSRWSPAMRGRVRALSAAATALWLVVLTLACAQAGWRALAQGDRSATLAWPMALYWLPLVIGCLLSVLACVLLVRREWPRRSPR